MSAEVTIQVGERQILADLQPNNLQGLRAEFDEICKEDEALGNRRREFAPTFSIGSKGARVEVKRKHVFKDGEIVFVNWTPLNCEKTEVHKELDIEDVNKSHAKETGTDFMNRVHEPGDASTSNSSNSQETESYGEVEEYYTTDQWKRMPKYLKERERSRFEIHEMKMKQGLTTTPFQPSEKDSPGSSPEHQPMPKKSKQSSSRKSRKEVEENSSWDEMDSEQNGSSDSDSFLWKDPNREDLDGHRSLVSKSTLEDHLQAGPSNAGAGDSLTQEDIRKIKPELPLYDIPKILQKKYDKGNDILQRAITNLQTNGIVTGKERQRLVRILTRHLFYKIVKDPKQATPDMREGLAKSIVFHFNKFQEPCDGKTTYPWKSLYDRKYGRGWIANASRSVQKKHRTKKSSSNKENRKPAEAAVLTETDDDVIQALALLMPGRAERNQILDGMKNTYSNRNAMRENQMPMAVMLKKFPHLASYDGEVLQEEFSRMKPEAQDMSLKFTRLLPNILALDSSEISLPIEDDVLRGLIIISRKLPRDIRTRHDPKRKSTAANLSDILEVVQLGEDIDAYILQKMEKAVGPIQPYLVAVKSPARNRVAKCFLVLDLKPVQLSGTSMIKCVEMLLKSYFIFNVQYPLGWRSTLHCLATCFANIFEAQSRRCRPDTITPSERDLMNVLKTA